MKARILALLALAGLGLQGCTMVMEKNPYIHTLQQQRDYIKQAHHAYDEQSKIYAEVTKRSSTPQAAPYPAMQADLKGMKSQLDALDPQATELMRLETEIKTIGKGDIQSGTPEWDPAMKNRDAAIAISAKIKTSGDAFNGYANAFSKDADAGGVGYIKASDFKKKLKSNTGSLTKAVVEAKKKIADAKAQLAGTVVIGGGKAQAMATLGRMQVLAGKIEAKSAPVEAKALAFINATTTEDIYRGPGLPKLAVVEELSQAMKDLEPLINQFNAEVEKLKN